MLQPKRSKAANARPMSIGAGRFVAGQQRDIHLAAPAVVGPETKLDRLRCADRAIGQADIARANPQIIFRAGFLAEAANRDRSGKLAALQPNIVHLAEVQRFIEPEQGPVGCLEDHGFAPTRIFRGVRITRQKDDR